MKCYRQWASTSCILKKFCNELACYGKLGRSCLRKKKKFREGRGVRQRKKGSRNIERTGGDLLESGKTEIRSRDFISFDDFPLWSSSPPFHCSCCFERVRGCNNLIRRIMKGKMLRKSFGNVSVFWRIVFWLVRNRFCNI